jgi:hypothetical protein
MHKMKTNSTDVHVAPLIDLTEAEQFLKLLDPQAEKFTFQTFDDSPKKRGNLISVMHGTLVKHAATLSKLNSEGAGIFVTVNKTDLRGRESKNVTDVRSFFADTDGAPLDPIIKASLDGKILPFRTVESSPGKYHVYWRTDCELGEFKEIQQAIAAKFGTDKSVNDLSRVMRLPGFFHNKHEPVLVRILESDANAVAYTPSEVMKGLALKAATSKARGSAANDEQNIGSKKLPETPENIERVKFILAATSADCDRSKWLKIVFAIASLGWICGEQLARDWSKSAQDKYNESDFNRDWHSYDPTKGIGFGTLVHYAKEAGWQPPKASSLFHDETETPDWLSSLNFDYAWIEKEAGIYRQEHGDFIESAKFKIQHYNQQIDLPPDSRAKPIGCGTAWLQHPKRRQHKKIVLRPNEGVITSDNCLNEWRGFAVKPISGDVTPYLELLERLVPIQTEREYYLCWNAHLFQRPDVKMFTAIVLMSREQGVGKNLLAETSSAIIGTVHSTVIGQTELAAPFNGWANRKILVIGDEVSSSNRRQDADRLKGLITGTTIYINEKNQPAREVANLVNFIFSSNHGDAMFMDDNDRRFNVFEITAGRLPIEMAKEFVAWRDNVGLSALLNFFLSYDISAFDPKAPALMTIAKQQMVNSNQSDLEMWLGDVIASGAGQLFGREIATSHEVAKRYNNDTGNRASAKAVAGASKRLGAYQRTNQVRISTNKKLRVIAFENPKAWEQRPEIDWASEMLKQFKEN